MNNVCRDGQIWIFLTLYDTIRIVRTVRTVRIVTQYIEISLNLVRIYEKRSTRRSFMRTIRIVTIRLPIPRSDPSSALL